MPGSYITLKTIVPTDDNPNRLSNRLGDRQMEMNDYAREGYELATTTTVQLDDSEAVIIDTFAKSRRD